MIIKRRINIFIFNGCIKTIFFLDFINFFDVFELTEYNEYLQN